MLSAQTKSCRQEFIDRITFDLVAVTDKDDAGILIGKLKNALTTTAAGSAGLDVV